MITAEGIAQEIADRLKIRDDIADTRVDSEDPTLVQVRTQGGKSYLIYVEPQLEANA